MSLPNVKITLANGQLGGLVSTSDGIMGLVLTGASEDGGVTAGTPFSVTSLTDLVNNAKLTSTGNPFAYKQIKEFYDEAVIGTKLYVLIVPSSMKVNMIADKTNANGAIKLLNYAAGDIKVIGIMTNDTVVYNGTTVVLDTLTNGINADIYTAASNLLSMANDFANTNQTPFRGIIGGTSFVSADSLLNLTSGSNNRVSVLIGDTIVANATGNGAALGLLLGRLAMIPVQRKISRVKTGALLTATAYIGNIDAAKATIADTLNTKGYITFRTFPNKSGYYFTGDPTATVTSDDYCFLSRGRVIDKAQIIAYATFVDEVDDEVPVNTDGTLSPAYTKYLEQKIVNQLNLIMTANREISSASCFVDPAQNVLSTNKVNVVLKVTPVGYASDIEVQLGFDNPALG